MSISYTRVWFDDGTWTDFPLSDFDYFTTRMQEYASDNKKEAVIIMYDLVGSKSSIFVSKIQMIFESTPEQRELASKLNKEVSDEAKNRERYWES